MKISHIIRRFPILALISAPLFIAALCIFYIISNLAAYIGGADK